MSYSLLELCAALFLAALLVGWMMPCPCSVTDENQAIEDMLWSESATQND